MSTLCYIAFLVTQQEKVIGRFDYSVHTLIEIQLYTVYFSTLIQLEITFHYNRVKCHRERALFPVQHFISIPALYPD